MPPVPPFRYDDLSFPVGDDEDVKLEVVFVSDANTGNTTTAIPSGNPVPDIKNAGTTTLGTGADLRGRNTIVASSISNLAPQVTEIKVNYMINGTLIQDHVNLKSVTNKPLIVLSISFPPKP